MESVKILSLILLCFFEGVETAPFINCNDSVPITMKFTFADPLVVYLGKPFHIIGGSVVKEVFPPKFKIKHKMQRKFLGKWWTLPCIGEKYDEAKPFYKHDYGLDEKPCYHEMPCEEFIYMGFNGTCPIQPGDYENYHLSIPVSPFPVPWWLSSGLYRAYIEAYDMDLKKLWFCGNITQYFEQGHDDELKHLAEVIV